MAALNGKRFSVGFIANLYFKNAPGLSYNSKYSQSCCCIW